MCLIEFTLESEECPLVVTCLMDLVDIISSPEFKKLYYKYRQQAPWIPYAVLTLLHSIIISFIEVSSHYLHVSNLTDNNTMPEYAVFEEIISTYQ